MDIRVLSPMLPLWIGQLVPMRNELTVDSSRIKLDTSTLTIHGHSCFITDVTTVGWPAGSYDKSN